jgi:hypothetical protein
MLRCSTASNATPYKAALLEVPKPSESVEAAEADHAPVGTKTKYKEERVMPTRAGRANPVIAFAPRTECSSSELGAFIDSCAAIFAFQD